MGRRQRSGFYSMNINPHDLIARGDAAQLAGVAVSTINQWVRRYPDFPRPFTRTSGGDIWIRQEMLAWLTETGRLSHHQETP